MQRLLLIFSLVLFLMFVQCSDKGTNPPEEKLCDISDSTSHDFFWHTDTLGIWPSALYGVSAIDKDNVWAVGEIKQPNGYYNAVKWNGDDYEYYQIHYGEGVPRIDVVLTFNSNSIWMFSGDRFHYLDGDTFKSGNIKPGEAKGSTNAAWGPSPSNFFLVGTNGSITHYDGNSFTLMESGTDISLHDITGYIDPKTRLTNAWATGPLTLLHYDGTQWQKVWDEENPLFPEGYNHPQAVYAPNHLNLIVAAYRPIYDIAGFCLNTNDPSYFKQIFTSDFYAYDMDGVGLNDVFIVGSINGVAHFNGNSLRKYQEVNSYSNRSVSYKDGNVYIVGPLMEQLGLFIRGTRL